MDSFYLWHMTSNYVYAYKEWLMFQFTEKKEEWGRGTFMGEYVKQERNGV